MNNIVKRYFIGKPNELEVLHGVNLKVYEGEFVAVVGPSGSGKSTLMNVIGALDLPTMGQYKLDGFDMFNAEEDDLSAIRNKKIGFVFQTYNLIARMSAVRNVELPMLYAGMGKRERNERAKELLTMMGMEERMHHNPDELSGGQKQRVAIARAMALGSEIVLMDEPFAALDAMSRNQMQDELIRIKEKEKMTVLFITHNIQEAISCGNRIMVMGKNGSIIENMKNPIEKPVTPASAGYGELWKHLNNLLRNGK